MKEFIDVFRMNEIPKETRIEIIEHLGKLINFKYGANITEPLVNVLVKILREPVRPTPVPRW